MLKLTPFFLAPLIAFATNPIDPYKTYLEWGTWDGQDWSRYEKPPLSRYETFSFVFEEFKKNDGKIVVELGTSRSFNHGGLIGCNQDDPSFWQPNDPSTWDWGAGFFTRMAAISLNGFASEIHTIDLISSHIERCKRMTSDFPHLLHYHVASSLDYLRSCEFPNGIDLLYLDTGDMHPIEPTALLQLEEAQIIVERNLLSPNGIILIDDVRNQTPKKFGETSDLGKSKYALPYLLENGFEIVVDGYQTVLKRKK